MIPSEYIVARAAAKLHTRLRELSATQSITTFGRTPRPGRDHETDGQ